MLHSILHSIFPPPSLVNSSSPWRPPWLAAPAEALAKGARLLPLERTPPSCGGDDDDDDDDWEEDNEEDDDEEEDNDDNASGVDDNTMMMVVVVVVIRRPSCLRWRR